MPDGCCECSLYLSLPPRIAWRVFLQARGQDKQKQWRLSEEKDLKITSATSKHWQWKSANTRRCLFKIWKITRTKKNIENNSPSRHFKFDLAVPCCSVLFVLHRSHPSLDAPSLLSLTQIGPFPHWSRDPGSLFPVLHLFGVRKVLSFLLLRLSRR